jgi:hypothetical protein
VTSISLSWSPVLSFDAACDVNGVTDCPSQGMLLDYAKGLAKRCVTI